MKILLTGASSFTGFHFARQLAREGWEVTAVLTQDPDRYTGLRRQRVLQLSEHCECVHGFRFGDEPFLELAARGWDLLAHHAADVTNYRSPDFDVCAAVAQNSANLSRVLQALQRGGTPRLLLTGSVFEGGEGAGSDGLPDMSPYGLSKRLTADLFAFYCRRAQIRLEKFVIPNPFGAWEEDRFTSYLIQAWLRGDTPSCRTPRYIRDNIHASLLARAYAQACRGGHTKYAPSGYVESMGQFVERLSRAMQNRLGRDCPYTLEADHPLTEPYIRVNTDACSFSDWDEAAAWDELAAFYQDRQK